MTPKSERIVFSSMIEAYMKGLGDLVTPRTLAELKQAGLNFEKLPPAFPEQQMLQFLEIFHRNAWPHLQLSERQRLLGHHAIKGWQNTLLGAAASAVMKLMGPARTLPRITRNFKTTNNFSEATFELVGEKEALVTVNDVQGMVTYWQGIFEAGLAIVADGGKVTIDRQLPGPDATFRLTWK
jgi:uncharacterized protein (TIGR02265 family)